MISYNIDPADLINQITQKKAKWLAKARVRTDEYANAKKYTGGKEFWGDIKEVYISLQHEKCAYCEMKLAGKRYGSKVHEVEHFRPKSRISAWPGSIKRLSNYTAPCATGSASTTGYHLLAYNPFNYAIACTRCNSSLKSDYFPVKGNRKFTEDDPSKMFSEQPLLIYPISNIDADPADLLTFIGVLAVPTQSAGFAYERGRITIDFFDLNHEDLTLRRAEVLAALYLALKAKENATNQNDIQEFLHGINGCISRQSSFSACANAFYTLYQTDRQQALDIGSEVLKLRPR